MSKSKNVGYYAMKNEARKEKLYWTTMPSRKKRKEEAVKVTREIMADKELYNYLMKCNELHNELMKPINEEDLVDYEEL